MGESGIGHIRDLLEKRDSYAHPHRQIRPCTSTIEDGAGSS